MKLRSFLHGTSITEVPDPVPEPASSLLFCTGLAGIAGVARCRTWNARGKGVKEGIVTLCWLLLLVVPAVGDARAGVVNFLMEGTYSTSDASLSVAAGTPFTITGSYDTSQQPWVGTYVRPDTLLRYGPMADITFGDPTLGFVTYDYSSLISHDYGLLQDIAQTFSAHPQPFSAGNIAECSYITALDCPHPYQDLSGFGLAVIDDFYELSATFFPSYMSGSGFVSYGWWEVTTPDGSGGSVVVWEHRVLEFAVTDFRITGTPNPVPEPATMFLLGSGVLCLAGFGSKRLRR